MTAPMILDGAVYGAAFLAYVQQMLVPTDMLRRRSSATARAESSQRL